MSHKTKPFDKLIGSKKTPDTFNKQVMSLKVEEAGSEFDLGAMAPTEDQLEKINRFARTPQTADQVVVLPSLACNDMIDRDVEKFSTDSIKAFVSMPEPYSPIGKSFLVGHDHKSLPIGRIFDAEAEKVDDINFLKLYSYIPRIDANKAYIENVNAGIYWAVSVGVTLGKATCHVGSKAHDWSWNPWFCSEGHEKGEYYDPNSDEKDDWGYPIPAEDATKGELCYRELSDPKDFYELSQVYLGAQYFAELTSKGKPFEGVYKAALLSPKVPIIGLSQEEAKKVDLPSEKALKEIADQYEITYTVDGNAEWTDKHGLKWTYSDNTKTVECLGKENLTSTPQLELNPASDPEHKIMLDTSNDGPELKEEFMNEDEILEAKEAGVDENLIQSAKTAQKPALFLLQKVQTLTDKVRELEPKVALGQKYVEDLKATAVAWYVKNHQVGEDKPVSVETFQKILDAVGDNVELIKELSREQEESTKAKFPETIRRSTVQEDVHETKELHEITPEKRAKITKLHG